MSVPRIQQSFCSTKISTVIKDAVQSLGYKEIRKNQFQNFFNTWCDHEIADSAQPRYCSIVTRPFSLLVRAGSGHETTLHEELHTDILYDLYTHCSCVVYSCNMRLPVRIACCDWAPLFNEVDSLPSSSTALWSPFLVSLECNSFG